MSKSNYHHWKEEFWENPKHVQTNLRVARHHDASSPHDQGELPQPPQTLRWWHEGGHLSYQHDDLWAIQPFLNSRYQLPLIMQYGPVDPHSSCWCIPSLVPSWPSYIGKKQPTDRPKARKLISDLHLKHSRVKMNYFQTCNLEREWKINFPLFSVYVCARHGRAIGETVRENENKEKFWRMRKCEIYL